jgi:type I restriction enzyme M protein
VGAASTGPNTNRNLAHEVKELLEDKISYGETFFVPPRARWHEGFTDEHNRLQPAIKNLQQNLGEMLNKALAALEDENDALQGVLKHINSKDVNLLSG